MLFHVVVSYIKGDFVKINDVCIVHNTYEYIIIIRNNNNNNNNTPDEISTLTILKIAASVLVHPLVAERTCVHNIIIVHDEQKNVDAE